MPTTAQGALFDAPPAPKRGKTLPQPIQWPGGIRPWDPIDEADTQLGWQHPWVSPRRAVEIRIQISRLAECGCTLASVAA